MEDFIIFLSTLWHRVFNKKWQACSNIWWNTAWRRVSISTQILNISLSRLSKPRPSTGEPSDEVVGFAPLHTPSPSPSPDSDSATTNTSNKQNKNHK